MYFVFFLLYIIYFTFCTVVTVHTGGEHNQSVQIFPSFHPYYKYSCICLTSINLQLTSNFSLIFSQLDTGSILYYEINHPPYLQYDQTISNTTTSYNQTIAISKFNKIGFEATLYFQQTKDGNLKQHWAYFTVTNSTYSNQNSFMISELDDSYFILIILAAVFSIFFGRFTKIYRFKTISIKWYYFIIYCIAVTIYITVLYFSPHRVAIYFQIVFIGLLGLLCCYYYMQQIIASCGFRYKIGKVYIRDIIAGLFSAGLISFWIYLDNNWIINDIIGLFIVGTVIQLIKMRNLKTSIIFFIVILIFSLVMQIIFSVTNFSLGYTLINDYPSPLQFQLPTIDFFPSRRCAWVLITDMIFPGFLINYSRRIDISFNSQVFSIVSYVSIALSLCIQMLIYKLVSYRLQLPQAIFSIPLQLLLLFIVSARRGEWSIIWHGGFYDKTMTRSSITRSVQWQAITQSLDENLLIN